MTGGQVSVPLVLRMPTGGYRNAAAQHSQSLEALFAHIPGLLVVTPATPADALGLLKTAIRIDDPVVFLEHKALYADAGDVPDDEHLVPLGEATTARVGRDVTVVAWSKMVSLALLAADRLSRDGIEAEVLDLRSLVPLDEDAVLTSVAHTGRLVVVQEAPRRAGYGAEIVATAVERGAGLMRGPIVRVCGRDTPIPMAPALERVVLPTPERIEAGIRAALVGSGSWVGARTPRRRSRRSRSTCRVLSGRVRGTRSRRKMRAVSSISSATCCAAVMSLPATSEPWFANRIAWLRSAARSTAAPSPSSPGGRYGTSTSRPTRMTK